MNDDMQAIGAAIVRRCAYGAVFGMTERRAGADDDFIVAVRIAFSL